MKKYLGILLVAFMCIMSPVEAKEINHFKTIADDNTEVKDIYNSSVAAFGENLTFKGEVKGLAIGAGNKVVDEGTSDYAILAGNTLELNGTVNNDAFIAGNIVNTDEVKVLRDAIIAASDIELNGEFNRNVSIYGSIVNLKDVHIKGNVKIYATEIKVSKDAVVEGTLSYPEDSKYTVAKGAAIGKTIKTDAIQTDDDENFFATLTAKIWSFLCLIVVFAFLSLVFPKAFETINEKFEKAEFGDYIETFTKGLITLILGPVLFVVLLLTMIGLPLGILLLVAYFVAMYLTTIFTAYLLGYKIWQKIFNKDTHILLIGIFGLFIICLLELIPGVRILVSILTTLIGLGLIILALKPSKN